MNSLYYHPDNCIGLIFKIGEDAFCESCWQMVYKKLIPNVSKKIINHEHLPSKKYRMWISEELLDEMPIKTVFSGAITQI